ncbi:hypothetical protein L596_000780 [Steinernema carpocapsae]|uniref:Uncharacterized protein n=1 Tax=Steinernema carpocapsae TaxID=34508 RepID=A0A4U8UJS2_STECR|nr:hypothetical protein L596_000780 [Steinernema carpocapsae]
MGFPVSIFLLSLFLASCVGQNVIVEGSITCGGAANVNSNVELVEREMITVDELKNEAWTENGKYRILGKQDEYESGFPYVVVTDFCLKNEECLRLTVYDVPKEKLGNIFTLNIDLKKRRGFATEQIWCKDNKDEYRFVEKQ